MSEKCPKCGVELHGLYVVNPPDNLEFNGEIHWSSACHQRQINNLEAYITELEDMMTREQIRSQLKKNGIDMKPAYARLQKLLDSR